MMQDNTIQQEKENLENSPSLKLTAAWSKFRLATPEKDRQSPLSRAQESIISPQSKSTETSTTSKSRKRKDPEDLLPPHKQLLFATSTTTDPSKRPSKRLKKVHSKRSIDINQPEARSSSAFFLNASAAGFSTGAPSSPADEPKALSATPDTALSSTKKRIQKLKHAVTAQTSKINCSLRRTFSASLGRGLQHVPTLIDTAPSQTLSSSDVNSVNTLSPESQVSAQTEKLHRSTSAFGAKVRTDKVNVKPQSPNSTSLSVLSTSEMSATASNTFKQSASCEAKSLSDKYLWCQRQSRSASVIHQVNARPLVIVPKPCLHADHSVLFTSCSGWKLELGDPSIVGSEVCSIEHPELDERWYNTYFVGRSHHNYVGLDSDGRPIVVSLIKEDNNKQYRAIIRTCTGEECRLLTEQDLKTSASTKTRLEKIVLKQMLPMLNSKTLRCVKETQLEKELQRYEDTNRQNVYKFGLLYVKEGQTTEEEMFSNTATSSRFEEFLSFLGSKVELKGFGGYNGGLDVRKNTTGTHSVYTKWNNYEIMFHVAPYLPHSTDDPQQLEKKRHIGNDIVVIVFLDSPHLTYNPDCILSHFNHVLAVIRPEETADAKETKLTTRYRFQIARKVTVPSFGPPLPLPPVFEKGNAFRNFLFTKLINGERASYFAKEICVGLDKMRKEFLLDWERRF
jgi:RAP1 GTPase activating protein 1